MRMRLLEFEGIPTFHFIPDKDQVIRIKWYPHKPPCYYLFLGHSVAGQKTHLFFVRIKAGTVFPMIYESVLAKQSFHRFDATRVLPVPVEVIDFVRDYLSQLPTHNGFTLPPGGRAIGGSYPAIRKKPPTVLRDEKRFSFLGEWMFAHKGETISQKALGRAWTALLASKGDRPGEGSTMRWARRIRERPQKWGRYNVFLEGEKGAYIIRCSEVL